MKFFSENAGFLPQTPLFCKKAISSRKPLKTFKHHHYHHFRPSASGWTGERKEEEAAGGRKEKGTEHKAEGITHSRRLFGQDQGNRFHRRTGWGSTAKTAKTTQFHHFRPCNRLIPLRPHCFTASTAKTASAPATASTTTTITVPVLFHHNRFHCYGYGSEKPLCSITASAVATASTTITTSAPVLFHRRTGFV